MAERKPTDLFYVIASNGNQPQRFVIGSDVQIGTESNPVELHITGRLSQSTKTLPASAGQQLIFPNNITVLNVETTSQFGVITVVLPSSPRGGQTCYVKDASGTAAKCNLVVKGAGSHKVDGKESYTINVAYGSVCFTWSGTGWSSLGGGANSEAVATYDGNVTPESVTLPADSLGNVMSYGNSKTYVYGYKGATELKSTTSTSPASGQFSVTATGINITPGQVDTSDKPAVYFPTGMNSASDDATIEYILKFEDGSTRKLIQNFSKSKTGADGATGTNGTNGADGRDAIEASLTPTSVTFVADASGTVSDYSSGTATIRVFSGATEYDSVASSAYVTAGSNSFYVSASGTNITAGAYSYAATAATFSAVSNMSANTAKVTYTLTISTSSGTTTRTLIQSFAKAIRGDNGTSTSDIIIGGGDATTANTLAYSLDAGSTWTGLGTTMFSVTCNAIIWTGRMWIATGGGATNSLAYSLNGTDWIGRGTTDLRNTRTGATATGTCILAYVPKAGSAQPRTLFVGGNTVTPNTTLIRSTDNGQTWTDISSSAESGAGSLDSIYSIVQAGESSGYPNRIAVGGWDSTGGRPGRSIKYSDNYGSTWSAQILCGLTYTYGMATNDSTIIAVGNDAYGDSRAGGPPYKNAVFSTNGGATWTECATQPFTSGGTGYAIAWNGFYWVACGIDAGATAPSIKISSNDGASWSSPTDSFYFDRTIRGVCWTGSRWVFVGGNDGGDELSIVYATAPSAVSGYTKGDSSSDGVLGDGRLTSGMTVAAKLLLPPNS